MDMAYINGTLNEVKEIPTRTNREMAVATLGKHSVKAFDKVAVALQGHAGRYVTLFGRFQPSRIDASINEFVVERMDAVASVNAPQEPTLYGSLPAKEDVATLNQQPAGATETQPMRTTRQ